MAKDLKGQILALLDDEGEQGFKLDSEIKRGKRSKSGKVSKKGKGSKMKNDLKRQSTRFYRNPYQNHKFKIFPRFFIKVEHLVKCRTLSSDLKRFAHVLEYYIHSVLPLVRVSIAPFICEMGKTF